MSASKSTVTVEMLTAALEKQKDGLLEAIKKLIQEHGVTASAAPTPAKKRKSKKSDESAEGSEPKPKREPNEWIKFSQRVERLVRESEEAAGTSKEEKMRTVVVKQFASHLKTQKAYAEWEDDEIKTALTSWTPPEPTEKKPKEPKAEKPKAEPKAKAKAKSESVTSESEAKPKPKPKAKAVAKKTDSRFHRWTHDGTDYWKNARGDVVSSEMDWVGHWDGKKIDESAAQPEDLEQAEFSESE